MVGILGLIVAIVCVIALIWKNWHMAIVSLAGALIVIAFNAMDPVTTLSEKFMTGMSGFAGNWFLLFMLGAIFGKVMGDSGASVGIANKMLKILGEKSVVLVVMLTGLVLSYGGIGTFIIAFSLYPIAVALFQKADIPKKLIVATIMVCPVTVCMAMLPGSPSTQNLIPTQYFGTTAYAGATLGLICSAIMFVSAYLFLNWQIKKAKAAGEHFVASPGEDIMDLNAVDEGDSVCWRMLRTDRSASGADVWYSVHDQHPVFLCSSDCHDLCNYRRLCPLQRPLKRKRGCFQRRRRWFKLPDRNLFHYGIWFRCIRISGL